MLNKELKANCILTCAYGYKLDYSQEAIKYYKYLPLMEISTKEDQGIIEEAADFIKDSISKTNVNIILFRLLSIASQVIQGQYLLW